MNNYLKRARSSSPLDDKRMKGFFKKRDMVEDVREKFVENLRFCRK